MKGQDGTSHGHSHGLSHSHGHGHSSFSLKGPLENLMPSLAGRGPRHGASESLRFHDRSGCQEVCICVACPSISLSFSGLVSRSYLILPKS